MSYRLLTQKKRQDAPKVYALHAPEVECSRQRQGPSLTSLASKSVSPQRQTQRDCVAPSKGGQFILHAKALPGNPYDGHTLKTVLPGIEAMTGAALSRILADAGYKGHNAPKKDRFKVYTQGQKRGVTAAVRRQFKRRAGIEPVIGHCKEKHRMDRNFLAHRDGDAINVHPRRCRLYFRRLLAWLVLRRLLKAFMHEPAPQIA